MGPHLIFLDSSVMLMEMLPFPIQQALESQGSAFFKAVATAMFSSLCSCISKSLALLISWESIWFPALGLSNLSFYTNIQTSLFVDDGLRLHFGLDHTAQTGKRGFELPKTSHSCSGSRAAHRRDGHAGKHRLLYTAPESARIMVNAPKEHHCPLLPL